MVHDATHGDEKYIEVKPDEYEQLCDLWACSRTVPDDVESVLLTWTGKVWYAYGDGFVEDHEWSSAPGHAKASLTDVRKDIKEATEGSCLPEVEVQDGDGDE